MRSVSRPRSGVLFLSLSLLFSVLSNGCGSSLSTLSGPLSGDSSERESVLARLFAMEDRRWYDSSLGARASASPDPLVRARTALSLGRLRDPEAAIYLPVLLEDREVEVRREAAFACGLAGDPRLVTFLSRALKDPDAETARRAAISLSRYAAPEAGRALVDALEIGPIAPAAAWSLWRPAFSEVSGVPLLTAAGRGNAELRKAALYSLLRRPHPALTAEALEGALTSDDDETASWAARAAGLRKEVSAVDVLVSMLDRTSASVKIQALAALEKIGASSKLPDRPAQRALVLSRDSHPGVALTAIRLLGRFPDEKAAQDRLVALIGTGGRAGAVALTALTVGSPAASEQLLAKGALPADVRLGAAEALNSMAAPERLPLVLRLLTDPAPRVRAATLGAIEPESLVNAAEIALRLLGDADLSVQAAAIDWAAPKLVSAKETEVSAAFEAAVTRALALREADFQVSAVDALSRLGDAGKGRLEALTSHPEPAVRQRALERLAEKWGREAAKGRYLPVETARTGADYLRMARRALGPAPRVAVATDAGTFEMTFDAVRAPLTVDALLGLIEAKFFDGLLFHRVVPDFVVQGGDPRGDGTGGPGFSIRDELSPVEYRRGTAGIALSGPDTGGSQWFVTLSRQPHLDGNYATFGQVTSGLEVLDSIQQGMKIRAMKVLETP